MYLNHIFGVKCWYSRRRWACSRVPKSTARLNINVAFAVVMALTPAMGPRGETLAWHGVVTGWLLLWLISRGFGQEKTNYIYIYTHNIYICMIYIYRYSIIKSFGFESIPQQLNTNVIRGLVKRAQLLWNVHNFYGTCTTAMERAQLLWNVRNFYDLYKFSNTAKSS